MPNVEFCHIIVDKGMLDDHMPDSVQEAVENLYKQLFGTEAHTMTQETKSDKIEPSVQYHNSNTEPNVMGEVSIQGCEPDDTEVAEGIINTSDVNEDTIEVTVHNTRELMITTMHHLLAKISRRICDTIIHLHMATI